MSDELFDVLEYTLHQVARRCGIVEGDVIGYRVEIVECGLSPDYFSHRAMRFFALA